AQERGEGADDLAARGELAPARRVRDADPVAAGAGTVTPHGASSQRPRSRSRTATRASGPRPATVSGGTTCCFLLSEYRPLPGGHPPPPSADSPARVGDGRPAQSRATPELGP